MVFNVSLPAKGYPWDISQDDGIFLAYPTGWLDIPGTSLGYQGYPKDILRISGISLGHS